MPSAPVSELPAAVERALPGERTPLEMLEDVIDLSIGLSVILMPLFLIAIPGVLLLLIAPVVLVGVVAAIPAVVAGVLLAPPYLLFRALRRRRAQ
jgi:Flp pilus assembly protein TadB